VKVGGCAMCVTVVSLTIGIHMGGDKAVLGRWLAQTEGVWFWLQVVTDRRNQGIQDISWPA
jgi:putative transposase